MADTFRLPELNIGDMVFWYSDPTSPSDPAIGWVSRKPGAQTITILVWGEDAGFIEKPSVRHVDDPFWIDSQAANSWMRWGAFRPHPSTALLKQVAEIAAALKLQAARSQKPKDKDAA